MTNLAARDIQSVRNAIFRHFVRTGQAPSVDETATALGLPSAVVADAYTALARAHVVALEPDAVPPHILSANPFSAHPTGYTAEIGDIRYWATSIWALWGLPVALGEEARLQAVCGYCGALYCHWLDDVIFTCATTQLFCDDDHLQRWLQATGRVQGAAMPMTQLIHLAELWYGNRLAPNFTGRTAGQAEALFVLAGLDSPFWRWNAG
jgi:hypothetical protein